MGLIKRKKSEYDGISHERNTRFRKKINVSIYEFLFYKYLFKPYSYAKCAHPCVCAVN